MVANGAEQSAQSFTLQLGGSFPVNTSWWSLRVVRMFEADYAITVSPNGSFSDYIDAAATNVYQIGGCGDKAPPPPPDVCTPSPSALGCYNVSGLWCTNKTRTSQGWKHDPNRGCLLRTGSQSDLSKDLSLERCAAQCNHDGRTHHDEHDPLIGVLDGKACFCGNPAQLALATATARARPLVECAATPCSGASTEKCGGVDRLAIFNYSIVHGVSPWQAHA